MMANKMAEILDTLPKMAPGQFQWMNGDERKVWENYMQGKLKRMIDAGGVRSSLPMNELVKQVH